jgi:hypothetical protein
VSDDLVFSTSEKTKSKPVINENKLKDFAKSIYDADSKKDIQYLRHKYF